MRFLALFLIVLIVSHKEADARRKQELQHRPSSSESSKIPALTQLISFITVSPTIPSTIVCTQSTTACPVARELLSERYDDLELSPSIVREV